MPQIDGDGNVTPGTGGSGSGSGSNRPTISVTKKLLSTSLNGKHYDATPGITPQWIVIHNTGGGTASSAYNWFNNPKNPAQTSAHYCVDDTQIIQCLEDNWKGHHAGGSGVKYQDQWRPSNSEDCTNNNSIGIEVADWGGKYTGEQFGKAIENAIDLTISLMKKHNIDVNHVIRHGDTQNKDCPHYIMKENKWGYFKEQLSYRTGGSLITNNGSGSGSGGFGGSGGGTGGGAVLDILPNLDHRYNIANMDKVKGACLIFLPPYNVCDPANRETHFKEWNNWDRKYHYIIDPKYNIDSNPQDDIPDLTNAKSISEMGSSEDSNTETTDQPEARTPAGDPEDGDNNNDNNNNNNNNTPTVEGPTAEEDNSIVIKGGFEKVENRLLQCYGITDNNKATYISRSLYDNKPMAHCIMIACFIPTHEDLKKNNISYEQVEKNIINSVSKILWANALEAKDLWREFDLNRAASPAQYLDRDRWKDLLLEIDKQVVWRNKKFGKVAAKYEKYIAVIPDQTIYDPGGGASGGGGGVFGSPNIGNISDVAQAVWTFFTGKGFTPQCTAGIMGNLQQESGMDPARLQSGGGKGRGICQWTVSEDRFKNMEALAKSRGKDWTDLQTQLDWLDMELQGKDPTTANLLKKKVGGYENFKRLTNINQACTVFEESFERAGKPMMEKRFAYAKQFYDKFASGGGGAAAASIEPRTPTSGSGGGTSFSWPTPTVTKVSSKFGPRKAPCKGASTYHKGIDISAPMNTDVHATAGGTVMYTRTSSTAGNYMEIDHGNGWSSRYLHLNSFVVKSGQVSANQVIAKSGNTGIGTGAHLHFEIKKDGTAVDPLQYVNPGTVVDNPGGSPGTGTPGEGGGSGGGSIGPLVNSIWGDIENPGPAGDLPYNGNSMGGLEHDDWGGKMTYYINKPTDENAAKPAIENVMKDNEYKEFCDTYFMGEIFNADGSVVVGTNFNKFWQLIDVLISEHEPYAKGFNQLVDAGITENDRLNALTTTFTTDNENVFHFNVVESGPGSANHCVKAADELNYLVTSTDLLVEPIYPDLVIPPKYTTSNYDQNSENTIPLSLLNELTGEDSLLKQYSFDYELLKEKFKATNKALGPVNFLEPYPTDDKIEELEIHYPKVMIDEIESQLYSDNHPGSPIAQPIAKNFAMISDAMMNQSRNVEKRLVKLENILSTVMRNQARLSSRISINCVYYGGQCAYGGKYKCIRCMHDDRINDGAIVTLDQCLNCTRYEPIIGQVYQILDESGMNGSIILDDMQMSYSDLDTYKRLNTQPMASPKYEYKNVDDDTNVGKKEEKDLIELWKEANKKAYLESKGKEVVSEVSADKGKVNEPVDTSYVFRMNWNEAFLNAQQPDVKPYTNEGIIMRFKKQDGDLSFAEEIKELDPEKDKDAIEDLQKKTKLANSQWTDTREKADSVQINKYSSEKFYFEGFAKMKACSTGALGGSSGLTGSSLGLGASECRKKICEMAETIVQECKDGKAWYSQANRTVDYNNPGYANGKKAYDCSGFVSCCYLNAGLKSMYSKTCGGGTLMDEIVNNSGDMWLMNEAGFAKAKPGDVIVVATSKVSEANMGKKVSINHAIIYMGDKTIAHAANSKKGIVKEPLESWRMNAGTHIFVRPSDLKNADATASNSSGSDNNNANNNNDNAAAPAVASVMSLRRTAPPMIDDYNYIMKIPGAVCTSYSGSDLGASGLGCEYDKTCASHNLPYGTKIYIPQLKETLGGDGVLTVTDTGSFFDFSIFTRKNIGKTNADVYILEWGDGKVAPSFTWTINLYVHNNRWSTVAPLWNDYKLMGGKLMTFVDFNPEDMKLTEHPNYNDK